MASARWYESVLTAVGEEHVFTVCMYVRRYLSVVDEGVSEDAKATLQVGPLDVVCSRVELPFEDSFHLAKTSKIPRLRAPQSTNTLPGQGCRSLRPCSCFLPSITRTKSKAVAHQKLDYVLLKCRKLPCEILHHASRTAQLWSSCIILALMGCCSILAHDYHGSGSRSQAAWTR